MVLMGAFSREQYLKRNYLIELPPTRYLVILFVLYCFGEFLTRGYLDNPGFVQILVI